MSRRLGNGFPEQFQPFAGGLKREDAKPRDAQGESVQVHAAVSDELVDRDNYSTGQPLLSVEAGTD